MNKEELIKEILDKINNQTVDIELCRNIDMPSYAHIGDAGMDVRSAVDITINPGETKVIPLGFKLNIPDHYEIQIRARSGLSLNTPLRLANGIGTIDSGYKDELGVIINNSSTTKSGTYDISCKGNKEGTYIIHKGDRIAQIVMNHYTTITFNKVDVINKDNDRRGGFGHTGVK